MHLSTSHVLIHYYTAVPINLFSDVFPFGSPFANGAACRVHETVDGQTKYHDGSSFPRQTEIARPGCDASARGQNRWP